MINGQTYASPGIARTIMYQFLALTLYEPTENLFTALAQDDSSQQLLAASCQFLGAEGEELTKDILNAVLGSGGNREEVLLDLRVEYNRLFVGPMPPVCPPYESFFDKQQPLEGQKTLMGPTSAAMEAALGSEGLEMTLDYAELPDHAAIELEFMYYLLSRAGAGEEDAEVYLQKANTFLIEHLSAWLPEFGTKLAGESYQPFYRGIGLLLAALTRADLESVKPEAH